MAIQKFDAVFSRFLFFNFLLILANLFGLAQTVQSLNFSSTIFLVMALLAYAFLYLLPAMLVMGLLKQPLRIIKGTGALRFYQVFLYICGIALMFLTQIFIYIDKFIYKLYGFHINGFVLNIVFTKGGLESMGSSDSMFMEVTLLLSLWLLAELVLFALAMKLEFPGRPAVGKLLRMNAVYLGLIAVCWLGQAMMYGVCVFKAVKPVPSASDAVPLYLPVTFSWQLRQLGLEQVRDPDFHLSDNSISSIQYPLKPIEIRPAYPNYNLVILVAESLRADMLNPEVMPATYQFAKKSAHFLNHYSAGNGTRMGLFGLFYGLYGNYWFEFLREQRPPILMETLMNRKYQFELFTSARFSYPEFDKTVFSGIPKENMHEADTRQGFDKSVFAGISEENMKEVTADKGWVRDRQNVAGMLDFFDRRDKARPFMTFMFFESPHARYYFPSETVIRPNYLEDFSYATMDLKRDIDLIKNRYINSCHHLDTQIERIITYLENNGLLDSTMVVIASDHGEEFMENGRWGHNSNYTQEQIQSAMVLYVPGMKPMESSKITSHLDIAPTLLNVLGVANPPQDYCLGYDLLGSTERDYTVVSDWSSLAYVGKTYKAVFPLKAAGFAQQTITTQNDDSVDSAGFYSQNQNVMVQILADSVKFYAAKGPRKKPQ